MDACSFVINIYQSYCFAWNPLLNTNKQKIENKSMDA